MKSLKTVQIKTRKGLIVFPDKVYFLEAIKSIIKEIKTSEIELFKKNVRGKK